ncbi:Peptidase C1A [Parasponia andersonii]|uniref:Peptidase C1A n=1 Tax=Parasponia andersonii TaxID=3476 RepID=A0A2P5A959_PARAD|nr:Peptidase C1A [Parasponia andersonii]
MAAPILTKIVFLICCVSFLASVQLALCHDFSFVGYSPEDLTSIDKLIELFESWIAKHGIVYESLEEKSMRFETFKDNLNQIDETNKKLSNYWLGLNDFADLSHEEFKNKYLGLAMKFCHDHNLKP